MATTKNYYAQALEIVSNPTTDFRLLVVEIAKHHPKAVVDAAYGFSWQAHAKELLAAGQKIEAIKHCRNVTGLGLREAKEAVEALD